MTSTTSPLVAVDIGNSRLKCGLFRGEVDAGGLPQPESMFALSPQEPLAPLFDWLDSHGVRRPRWCVASVNRQTTSVLCDAVREDCDPTGEVRVLRAEDLPLASDVPEPQKVGVDRLVSAVAANRLRDPNRPAIVVDIGTAITVDLVTEQGAFAGGAIMPGLGTSAAALHSLTDLLPLLDVTTLSEPPPPVGKTTVEAMQAGLFWGAAGAIRETVARIAAGQSAAPHVYLTGGPAGNLFRVLKDMAEHVPHLTLAGIVLSAAHSHAR